MRHILIINTFNVLMALSIMLMALSTIILKILKFLKISPSFSLSIYVFYMYI